MSKKVLILSGSPRKNGNSDLLCDEFMSGALESGNEVEKIRITEKKVSTCSACYYCRDHGGVCVHKDDMADILQKMVDADVLVLASPVYFYSVNAQLKAVIDRTVARWLEVKNKEFYYIVTMADEAHASADTTLACFRGYADCVDGAVEVSHNDKITIGKAFIEIASRYGMTIKPCAEGNELATYGADCSGCMTVDTFEKALHNRLEIPKGKVNQRNGACVCVLGVDIGAYDTCGHLCKYCYANADKALVRANMKKHNPESPFLIGESMPGDVIHEAIQKSWIDRQLRFDYFY